VSCHLGHFDHFSQLHCSSVTKIPLSACFGWKLKRNYYNLYLHFAGWTLADEMRRVPWTPPAHWMSKVFIFVLGFGLFGGATKVKASYRSGKCMQCTLSAGRNLCPFADNSDGSAFVLSQDLLLKNFRRVRRMFGWFRKLLGYFATYSYFSSSSAKVEVQN